MKVKIKPQRQYRLTVEMQFDNAEAKQQVFEGTSYDMSNFMDNSDDMLENWEESMDDAKEHVTMVLLRVERL